MFTGLVEAMGVVAGRTPRGPGLRLAIDGELSVQLGDSVSVAGACLTVQTLAPGRFTADVSAETLAKTTLGALDAGARVNLERAAQLGSRLGGHLVSGHVDGIGTVSAARNVGDAVEVTIEAPADLRAYLAPKGSVTVDGVSLTINRNTGSGFSVMLIPHTRSVTTLGELDRGRAVNLEIDLLARYVVHYLRARSAADTDSTLLDALSRAGYVKE